jgi:hypothetical protein
MLVCAWSVAGICVVRTQSIFHELEPHMSGVVRLLLRARKELIPRGTEQYLSHWGDVVSM